MLSFRKLTPAPGLTLVETNAPPAPGLGEVVISVRAAGICGSDLHVHEWHGGYDFMKSHLPVTLGHEFSGIVHAVGPDVTTSKPGDRVVVWPSSPCGACHECIKGTIQNCENKRTLGLYADGAFASHVLVRSNGVFQIPEGVDFDVAALTEPLCVGRRAVIVGEARPGSHALVLGPGTIGQAIAIFAREAGASVAIAGFNDAARLKVCNELGFTDTFDLSDDGERARMTDRHSDCDIVFEATGRSESITDALSLLRKEGILVVTGIHSQPVTIELTTLVRRKLQIRTSHGAQPDDWWQTLETIKQLGCRLNPMISHRLPLKDIQKGFDLALSRAASKVIIQPESDLLEGRKEP